jgi:nucleoside-diphosphate-sugar epimerase
MGSSDLRCAVTGTTGYVGSRISEYLAGYGWTVFEFARRPSHHPPGGPIHVSFQLESPVEPAIFQVNGIRVLIHCAYDFRLVKWDDIHRVNVDGSIRLLQAAHEAGVDKIIFISSISAFEGCRSLYGKAKLEIEKVAAAFGACIIRPGLVYGSRPSTGMFGSLQRAAAKSPLLPLIGSGKYMQHLIHEEDLCEFVLKMCCTECAFPGSPITAASPQGWRIRDLLQALAAPHFSKIRFLPIPWRVIWLGLKIQELLGVAPPFKSDSVVSLVWQNPNPDFLLAAQLGCNTREFKSGIHGTKCEVTRR